MLEWKAIYGDGRLDHWTVGDIHAYLLEHFPRKVSADRGLLGDTPSCVRDFVYFMSDRGTLAGGNSGVLADAAEEVSDEFLAVNRDRRNWGLAKLMFNSGAGAERLRLSPDCSIRQPRFEAPERGRSRRHRLRGIADGPRSRHDLRISGRDIAGLRSRRTHHKVCNLR